METDSYTLFIQFIASLIFLCLSRNDPTALTGKQALQRGRIPHMAAFTMNTYNINRQQATGNRENSHRPHFKWRNEKITTERRKRGKLG
jgi:hypothetical protein